MPEDITVVISDQGWPITADQLIGLSFTECGHYPGIPPSGATASVWCTSPGITGRYVYIYQPTSEWMMNFCEVEVLGVEYASEDRKISNERRTKSPNLNASRLGLQLFLRNIWKPGVKLRPKM